MLILCGAPLCVMAGDVEGTALRLEILGHITDHSLEPPGGAEQEAFLGADGTVQQIRDFLQGFDRYASYLPPDEYRDILHVRRGFSHGVGMDLVRDPANRIICIPYPGSQAQKGGITYGDLLLEVDGHPVENLDMEDVGALVRGDAGSTVLLKIRDRNGREHQAGFDRESLSETTVSLERPVEGIPRIRIYHFGRHTGSELRQIIEKFGEKLGEKLGEQRGPIKELILDLRGNTGGELLAAVECAAMFRPQGACLLHIQDKKGSTKKLAETDGDWRNIFVYIWQDDLTASAAEVLIAALSDAVSIGATTAGKARVQETFRLQNNGILKLTVEELLYTNGEHGWQNSGFAPRFKTTGPRQSDTDFIQLTLSAGKKGVNN